MWSGLLRSYAMQMSDFECCHSNRTDTVISQVVRQPTSHILKVGCPSIVERMGNCHCHAHGLGEKSWHIAWERSGVQTCDASREGAVVWWNTDGPTANAVHVIRVPATRGQTSALREMQGSPSSPRNSGTSIGFALTGDDDKASWGGNPIKCWGWCFTPHVSTFKTTASAQFTYCLTSSIVIIRDNKDDTSVMRTHCRDSPLTDNKAACNLLSAYQSNYFTHKK